MTTSRSDLESIKKDLFKSAMKGDWHRVQKIYKEHPETHQARITRSGDTALHIAVSDGKERVVEQLVQLIREPEGAMAVKALKIGNERGNTPLHLAASSGNVRMCKYIAEIHPKLIGERNQDSETPFFLAALHGRKDAFILLHSTIPESGNSQAGYSYSRRNDGETILHCAISGEYFDLAFQIIYLYENLVNSVNEKGFSPLHLLASNPSAFPSGSHIRRFGKIIYNCIFVDKLEFQTQNSEPLLEELKNEDAAKFPENYRTCINFARLLRKLLHIVVLKLSYFPSLVVGGANSKNTTREQPDADCEGQRKRQLFPPNYSTCFESIKFVSKAMLIVLGLGSMAIVKIKERKEKHVWSVQIMDELLERTSIFEYEDNGRNPQQTAPLPPEDGGDVAFNTLAVPSLPPEDDSGENREEMNKRINEDGKNEDELLKRTSIFEDEDNGRNPQQTAPLPPEDGGDVAFNTLAVPSLPPDDDSGENREEMNKRINEDGKNDLKPEMDKRLTPIRIAAINAATEMVEKILQLLHVNILRTGENYLHPEVSKRETPMLIAAKHGVAEMVKKILERYPVAIHDMNSEKKNVVLLAVENRQSHVYKLLLDMKTVKESIFHKVDEDGNSALHLAARLGDQYTPWLIPGAALQMQWEIKWYEFVKKSKPLHFFVHFNKHGKTAKDVFTETHKDLVKSGSEWLGSTSQSCSVVAALIAAVAFATSSTVPGGVKENNGTPNLENEPAFDVFAIASLVALCFSVTALVIFLSILTSRYQERDFGTDLPRKVILGLTSLFVSIASMLIAFCAGHFFVLKDKFKFAAFPVYTATCLPVTFFALAQFPLYFDLLRATFREVPQRSYQVIPR